MIYPIVLYGDAVHLRKRPPRLKKGSIDIKELSEDMFETMKAASGIGLAAPQIGKSIRMFVVDASPLEDEEVNTFKQVFVNPVMIEEVGDSWAFEEGCLSIPGVREDVTRNERLRIRFFDEEWNEHEQEFDGMKARIIQHEFDHLNGVLFTDYLTPLKKRFVKRETLEY